MIDQTDIQDHNGDQIIDLLPLPNARRRAVFYEAVQNGFYHMPPFILHLPCAEEEGREVSLRIPLADFDYTRYHFRILSRNTDLRASAHPAAPLSEEHHALAQQWHCDRFGISDPDFSDDTINTYMSEMMGDADRVIEWRDRDGDLVGACLLGCGRDMDGHHLAHAFYFYYDTTQMHRHMGYTMLLGIMDGLKTAGYDYFFPGVYQPKGPYAYKANLSPSTQWWTRKGWEPLPLSQRPRPSAPCGLRLSLRHGLKL